jgi:hypothetical protein
MPVHKTGIYFAGIRRMGLECAPVPFDPVLLTLLKVFEETFIIQMPDPGEITAMAFGSTNNRLCLCSCNDMVQSWTISKDPLTGKWLPINIFSRRFPGLSPQAITFAAFDNSQDRDIIVLGFHNSGPI